MAKRTVKSVKRNIQKLLLEYARKRDKQCIFYGKDVGKCGGVTTADHIITRGRANTYADTDNVILACFYHHLQWKPTNPTLYAKIVEEVIGKKRYKEIHEKGRILRYSMSLKEWLEEEEKLKEKLNEKA